MNHPSTIVADCHISQITFPGNRGPTIDIFGKGNNPGAPMHWGMYTEQGFHMNDSLPQAMNHAGIGGFLTGEAVNAYHPNCRLFNAEVSHPTDFHESMPLGEDYILYYNHEAAGLEVPKGSVAIFTTADCPIVVGWHEDDRDGNKLVAAHAGLGELVNLPRIRGEALDRKHESVIPKMLGLFTGRNFNRLRFVIIPGISQTGFTHPPNHPEWDKRNKALIRHLRSNRANPDHFCTESEGGVNLVNLIDDQLIAQGVHSKNISIAEIGHTDHDPRLWSNRRDNPGPSGRNLIVIHHT